MKLLCLCIIGALSAVTGELDPRLPVSTLVREDIFAGLLVNDMARFEIGERNIDRILAERPDQRGSALGWKGAVTIFRAIRALEGGDRAEYSKLYSQGKAFVAEAERAEPENFRVIAVIGASHGFLADRLATEDRAAAWEKAYGNFKKMAEVQMPMIDKLPLHIKGELLAGLAQSAQRTGRAEEAAQYLKQMSTQLAATPYESIATKWSEDPSMAARTSLTCKSCHEPGRLEARLKALETGSGAPPAKP